MAVGHGLAVRDRSCVPGFLIGGTHFDYRKITLESDPEIFAWRDKFTAYVLMRAAWYPSHAWYSSALPVLFIPSGDVACKLFIRVFVKLYGMGPRPPRGTYVHPSPRLFAPPPGASLSPPPQAVDTTFAVMRRLQERSQAGLQGRRRKFVFKFNSNQSPLPNLNPQLNLCCPHSSS